jgi:hypothetical protein
MQDPVQADRFRPFGGRGGREAAHRIGDEDAGADQARSIEAEQQGPPSSLPAARQRAPHADGGDDHYPASDKEAGDPDPAGAAVAEKAGVVVRL